jgi:hypothetical protein
MAGARRQAPLRDLLAVLRWCGVPVDERRFRQKVDVQ